MDPFVGEIRIFTGNFAPTGWFLCQGQILPISAYQALFAIIGTTYGGNGTSNFQLPNLQGRFPIGAGQSPFGTNYNLGQAGGVEQVALTINNLPAHTHVATFTPTGGGAPTVNVTVNGSSAAAGTSAPAGNYLAGLASGGSARSGELYVANPAPSSLGAIAGVSATASGGITGGTVANAATGNSLPFSPTPSYQGINYIIAYNGIFPSRG